MTAGIGPKCQILFGLAIGPNFVSGGGITGSSTRNSLSPSCFESLQLLKSAYRNGHITAAADAAKHLVPYSDPPGTNLLRSYPSVEI